MKKEYVTPTMVGERFSADEYVAACVTGTIQCAILELHRMHKMMEPLHLKIMKESGMDHAEKMRRFRLIAVQEEVMKCEMGK